MEKKEEIYQYIHNESIHMVEKKEFDDLGFDSTLVSQKMKMDRANCSRLLNQLFNDGRLIKQLDRPVIFYDKEVIENITGDTYIPSLIQKGQKITDYVYPVTEEKKDPINSFSRYITNSPLSKMTIPVEQAKSAILYPSGLNILVIGQQGSGRLQFARSIFNFAKESNVIDHNQKCVIVECLNYSDQSPENFLRFIFGEFESSTNKNKKGVLNSGNNIVIFNNIDQLPDKSANALFNAILDKTYSPLNSNKIIELKTIIVATTSSKSLLDISDVHRCFPMTINLPSLSERSILEKLVIILQYFQDESIIINKSIRISKDVLSCFVMSEYRGNLAHLRSEIRQSCATAHHRFLRQKSMYISIEFDDISTQVLQDIHNINNRLDELHENLNLFKNEYLVFSPFQENTELRLLYDLNNTSEEMISLNVIQAQEDLISQCIKDINQASKTKLNTIRSMSVKKTYDIVYPLVQGHPICKNELLLYGLLNHITQIIHRTIEGLTQSLFAPLSTKIAKKSDYKLAYLINDQYIQTYKIPIEQVEIDYIATYLYFSSQWINKEYTQLLLCFADNRTAKNYANYLNSRSTKIYIESFPYKKTDFTSFSESLLNKIHQINCGKGVIVATDLDNVSKFLRSQKQYEKDFSIIADISLQNLISVLAKIETLGTSLKNIKDKDTVNQIENKLLLTDDDDDNLDLLKEIQSKLLNESLTFLNPEKACHTLYPVLLSILEDLSIPYRDDILIKFLFHTSFTIERCIKKETYIYPKAKSLIKKYNDLYQILEKNLQIVYEVFDIQFPVSEIGFIIEIFLPYLQN